jgi:hypothetical protein
MARYVGAAVATAGIAAIYAGTIADRTAEGEDASDALAAAVSRSSFALAIVAAAGIAFAVLNSKHRARKTRAVDYAAHAAAAAHTLPVGRPEGSS